MMQVSHVETANTHAIMGGGKAEAFEMSDSAEFFTVLSDTLYRDKKRAVVREIICNAWDAHIASGNTARPIEITLTDEEMSIKDFGLGIPHKKVKPIYCVYGASTKVKSEEETGGFGLGSKAPFAYTDHFSVINHHSGKKVVYAISRGGVETQGKPDFRPMVEVPTETTGVTVTLPIRSADDRREFEKNIRQVTHQGGMKVKLNDAEIDRVDYTEARKSGFMVTNGCSGLNESRVYLLYGTVLYPVVSTENEIYRAKRRVGDLIPADNNRIILVAPPNSVGVTPSREALSYTDKTIATVKELCDRMSRRVKPLRAYAAKLLIAQVLEEGNRYKLKNVSDGGGNIKTLGTYLTATTPLDAAKISVNHEFWWGMDEEERARIVGTAAAKKFRDSRRTLRRAFLDGYRRSGRGESEYHLEKEAATYSMRKHLRALGHAGLLGKSFRVEGGTISDLRTANMATSRRRIPAENVLIITQSRADAVIEAKSYAMGSNNGRSGSRSRSFVCVSIPRSKVRLREEMTRCAERYGIKVIEITKAVSKPSRKVVVKDKFLSLKNFEVGSAGFQGDADLENPTHYIRITQTIQEMRDSRWFYGVREYLLERHEDLAVVRSEAQVRRVEAVGAKDAMTELWVSLSKTFKTRDTKAAVLLEDNCITTSGESRWHAESCAASIMEHHPVTFFEFAPLKVGSKKKVIERAEAIRVLKKYISSNSYNLPKDYPFNNYSLAELCTKARETFNGDLLEHAAFNRIWRDLDLISTYHMESWRKSDISGETIIKMIRALKRVDTKGDEE